MKINTPPRTPNAGAAMGEAGGGVAGMERGDRLGGERGGGIFS